ncbi:MAG: Rpp14/Pop5 family protein [Candidatus Helarchaeota archaeon]
MKLKKHRYIVFRFFTENEIQINQFTKNLWESIYELFGCKGASETGLWIIDLDNNEKKGIIRCDLESLTKIRIALTLLSEISRNVPIMIQILGVSGTIKKAREKYY